MPREVEGRGLVRQREIEIAARDREFVTFGRAGGEVLVRRRPCRRNLPIDLKHPSRNNAVRAVELPFPAIGAAPAQYSVPTLRRGRLLG